MVKNLLLLSIFALFFLGCKQEDLTPSWLKINTFSFTTNEATQGANTSNITDAWVYMDEKPLGVFELPCVLPVLDKGEHQFTIFPGIKNNGISSSRIRYPFYNTYETIVDLALDDTTTIFPSTTYKSNLTFAYIEDFEGAGISLAKSGSSDTNIVFIEKAEFPELVAYGEKCGGIFFEGDDTLYAGSTLETLALPKNQDVFLEVDYRNDNKLSMGTIAIFPNGSTQERTPLVSMTPQQSGSEVWKKIYINLKEDISFSITASAFEIYFLAKRDKGNVVSNIYIDNIKVVHYQ